MTNYLLKSIIKETLYDIPKLDTLVKDIHIQCKQYAIDLVKWFVQQGQVTASDLFDSIYRIANFSDIINGIFKYYHKDKLQNSAGVIRWAIDDSKKYKSSICHAIQNTLQSDDLYLLSYIDNTQKLFIDEIGNQSADLVFFEIKAETDIKMLAKLFYTFIRSILKTILNSSILLYVLSYAQQLTIHDALFDSN